MRNIREKDFMEYMGTREAQFLEPASSWLDEWMKADEINEDEDLLPWPKADDLIQFRRGEVTIWGGINGHGKSLVLGQAVLIWARHTKVAIASLEMKPVQTIARMAKQCGQIDSPNEAYKRSFVNWADDRIWIYDQLDQVPFDRILGMIHYAAVELGCKHIVVDSLMKCGISDDDYKGQKDFVDSLCWAAKTRDVHIHLVAHMRKKGSETERPNKFDVMGASAITNLVDNLIIVHRNKQKESDIEEGKQVHDLEPDATLEVRKNRHGGTEGGIKLYFIPRYNQFVSQPNRSMVFVNIPMIEAVA